ncbi:MAG: 5'/3'-nucleotidase SurE [Bacteroidetes bacterium]|jgi:5'-nucleotidase|nr:5'/3'-nucleotidase SurE [Bacteroidota bacterium]MBT6685806.1 5'/3'-nucleotidase SurE [Bacteroidota bacterium]MBT7143718.1 5'/3'-nucleotidase SurE [Bacteroidota bacterium]MBT7491945.1 5'/3'-nucleotidase SurE [Bacteroidota bacterium]
MSKKENKPLLLLTNDDGINAKGLKVLIEAFAGFGELLVVVPDKGQSAMSHAITINQPIFLNKIKEKENLTIYTCSGTPVDCVKLALNKITKRKPDFLISGINHGTNSSVSIIYSGTMAAALEGYINDIPSIGFSVIDHSPDANFEIAEKYSKIIFKKISENNLPKNICLNVNFPNTKPENVRGIKFSRQARAKWVEEFEKRTNPHNKEYYWLTGKFQNFEENAEDTDEWALKNNYVSIVPVQFDFTAYDTLKIFKDKNYEIEI